MTTKEILFLSVISFLIVVLISCLKKLHDYKKRLKRFRETLKKTRPKRSEIYNDASYFYPDVYPDVHYDIHQNITVESSSPNLMPMSSRYLDAEVHEPTGKILLDGIDSTVNLFGDILSGKI